jgi:hypothetical protein
MGTCNSFSISSRRLNSFLSLLTLSEISQLFQVIKASGGWISLNLGSKQGIVKSLAKDPTRLLRRLFRQDLCRRAHRYNRGDKSGQDILRRSKSSASDLCLPFSKSIRDCRKWETRIGKCRTYHYSGLAHASYS